jgi:hypothetical protein
LVASDQRRLYDVSRFVSSSIERAKSDLPLSFTFSLTVACDPSSNGTGQQHVGNDSNNVLPGRLGTIPNARNMKRLRSRHEKRRIIKCRTNGTTTTSLMGTSNDDDHVVWNVKKVLWLSGTRSSKEPMSKGHSLG